MTLPTAQERRREQRADVRRTILDATEALLGERGYEAFTIRRLTERCGYTAPTLYHHFGDKNGLIDALLEERFLGLLALLREVPEHEDPAVTIREQMRAFLRFGLRNPTHYRMLSIARDPEADPLPAAEQARAWLDRPWIALAESARLQVDDIEIAQRAAWAMMHGLLSLHANRPDLAWSERMFEQSIVAVLQGLVAPARSNRADGRAVGAR